VLIEIDPMNHRHHPVHAASLKPFACIALALSAWHTPAQAQTQDEQYTFYLSASCSQMHFQRDGSGDILPGQASPRLKAFCDGPPPVGGVITNGASGGGASTATGRSVADDVASRRRRAIKRPDNHQATTSTDDVRSKVNADDFSVSSDNASAYVSLRYQHEEQKVTHFEGGRSSNLFGAAIGTDYRFTNSAVAGIALKVESLSGDFDSGGDYDTHTTGALLYGSWYPLANLFVDVNAGIDLVSTDTTRFVSFSRTVISAGVPNTIVLLRPTAASSDPDSRATEAELRSGYDVVLNTFTIGPRVGMKHRRTTLDAYIENGATPMTLAVDKQTTTSLISTVGAQASKVFTPASAVVVTQLNLDWLHEFKNDQRTITARLAGDLRASPTQLRFQNEAPDRDVAVARISVAAIFPHGFSSFVAVDSLFGHSYLNRYGANVGVRKEF
jgi:uncharacterized protein YhjY with autotransporter beta-barrel domain